MQACSHKAGDRYARQSGAEGGSLSTALTSSSDSPESAGEASSWSNVLAAAFSTSLGAALLCTPFVPATSWPWSPLKKSQHGMTRCTFRICQMKSTVSCVEERRSLKCSSRHRLPSLAWHCNVFQEALIGIGPLCLSFVEKAGSHLCGVFGGPCCESERPHCWPHQQVHWQATHHQTMSRFGPAQREQPQKKTKADLSTSRH